MKHTLGTASKATGKAKSTILRAIKSGTMSATKSLNGSYQIDPAELHRVFDPICSTQRSDTATEPPSESVELLRLRLEILEQERDRERAQLEATVADLRQRLDVSESRLSGLLTDQRAKKTSWLPWRRRSS